jgi:hypothetical protein
MQALFAERQKAVEVMGPSTPAPFDVTGGMLDFAAQVSRPSAWSFAQMPDSFEETGRPARSKDQSLRAPLSCADAWLTFSQGLFTDKAGVLSLLVKQPPGIDFQAVCLGKPLQMKGALLLADC